MKQDLSHIDSFHIPGGRGIDGGAIALPNGLRVIYSFGEGWDHVSASRQDRCPTWAEMCYVKDLFFDAEECVIQYHPPRSRYVNNHPYCLHLWKPHAGELPMPPVDLVGDLTGKKGRASA